jgi:hypothetical protein
MRFYFKNTPKSKPKFGVVALMRGFQPLLHGRLLELLGASTQLAICSKSPCSIAISCWPYLQDAISSSPPLQLSRKVVRTRSEHSSQSAHTLHYVRTHPGTIVEQNLISAKLARLCGDCRLHWVQTEKAEIPSCCIHVKVILHFLMDITFSLYRERRKTIQYR